MDLATRDPDALQEKLIRYAADLKRAGRADAYVVKTLNGLRNYLRFRKANFSGFPILSSADGSTLVNERVPTQEELGVVLEHLSLRGRGIALLMAHAGLRPQVIGNYGGKKGLTLADLPELDLKTLTFRQVPFLVRVPANLSKTGKAYNTFGTRQLAVVLSAYLGERRVEGERLSPASPVVAGTGVTSLRGAALESRTTDKTPSFLVTGAVVKELRQALRASVPEGVTWRPYVLRAYCSTRLLIAEGDGRISRDLSQAVLGHSTGVAGRYHVGKRWGEELLAEARREYSRAAEFLETTPTRKDSKEDVLRTLLQAVEQATGKKSAGPITGDDLVKAIKDALGSGSKAGATGPAASPVPRPGPQRVVSVGDLERLINDGWTYVAGVGSDRAIVTAPANSGQTGLA